MPVIGPFLASLELGSAVTAGDLIMFPLLARQAAPSAYLTLSDAVRSGLFTVTEVSEAGSVPTLRATNKAERGVLILDGEELVGAKQNRIVNLTILVAPQSTLDIPVSCVEAGRWSFRTSHFEPAGRAFHASGRAAKLQQVTESLRASASRTADQGAIWSEIDAKSARLGAASATRAAEAMFRKEAARLDDITAALRPQERQVGAVFAIRGGIAGLDAFDSPETFARLAPALLRSYGLDALDHGVSGGPFARPDPAEFLEAVAAASETVFDAVGLGADVRLEASAISGGALVLDRVVHLVAFPRAAASGHPPRSHRWGG